MKALPSLLKIAALLLVWSVALFSQESPLQADTLIDTAQTAGLREAHPVVSAPDYTTMEGEQAFRTAAEQYNIGEWDQARLGFERCLQLGLRDFRVHYNLANSWYRLGEIGRAIQHYHIALLIEPGNHSAQENLKQAESLRLDKQEPHPIDPLFGAIWKLHAALSPALSARLLLAAALLLGVLGSALLFAQGRWRNLLIVAFILTAVATFPVALSAAYKAWGIEFEPRAVILSPIVDLRSSPTNNSQVVGTLHTGTVVEPRHSESDWILVKAAEGLEGYLRQSDLGWINGQ